VTHPSVRSLHRLALLALALGMAACTTTLRKAPDYESRMRGVHKFGLMPPDATATLIVFRGDNQSMPEIVAHSAPELLDAVTREIRKHDYMVDRIVVVAPPEPLLVVAQVPGARPTPAPPREPPPAPAPALALQPADPNGPAPVPDEASVTTPETPDEPPPAPEVATAENADSPELRFAATQAQKAAEQAMNEMWNPIQMKKSEALKYKRSLGPQVNQFADMVDAEAVLFLRYSYMTKSGGEVAKDVAFSVLLAAATLGNVVVVNDVTAARLDVCLVDGATGDVLFANTATISLMFGQPSIEGLVSQAMAGFSPRSR
jgi:hypothetical protein